MIDWAKLKVADLRIELKRRNMSHLGLKGALIARLDDADAAMLKAQTESPETVQDQANSAATSPDTVSGARHSSEPDAAAASEKLPSVATGSDFAASKPEPTAELKGTTDQRTQTPSQDKGPDPILLATAESTDRNSTGSKSSVAMDTREMIEDRQKRKQRSQSPIPSANDIARKRLRMETIIETQDKGAKPESRVESTDWAQANKQKAEDAATVASLQESGMDIDIPNEDDMKQGYMEGLSYSVSKSHGDDRIDSIVAGKRDEEIEPPVANQMKDQDSYMIEADDQERSVTPAIHPATSALYIRDFMRPLNPSMLKEHLLNLATGAGQVKDPDVIVNFHLDKIRTHAFVSFTTTSAASRVRSALHGCVWPNERDRKPLWADFVPPERVHEWISEEQSTSAGGRQPLQKWEIIYHTNEDRSVTATLQDVTNGPAMHQAQSKQHSMRVATPEASYRIEEPVIPSEPRAHNSSRRGVAQDRSELDRLFRSTLTKPTLYWKPVSKELADRRLANIAAHTSKEPNRDLGTELNRYTFEDGDVLVDRGPEIFPGIRPPPGHRHSNRGGGARGRNRANYQGRMGYGDGADRGRYDSYKGDGRDGREGRNGRDEPKYDWDGHRGGGNGGRRGGHNFRDNRRY